MNMFFTCTFPSVMCSGDDTFQTYMKFRIILAFGYIQMTHRLMVLPYDRMYTER